VPWVAFGRSIFGLWCGLCRWASSDFELVLWVGVAGAFGEEVVGGGRCFFGLWAWLVLMGVAGLEGETGDRAAAAFLKMLGHLGEELGGKGKLTRSGFFFFF
jgi:hypothetical protein